jgi:hypothetical protein
LLQSEDAPEAPFSAALVLAAALGFLLCVGVLCCVVVGGPSEHLFSEALGQAVALGLTFFGVRASWIAVVKKKLISFLN